MSKYKPSKPYKPGKLDPETLKRFVANLYKNPKLKEEVMNDLHSMGACATTEKHFDLNRHQKRELQTIKDRDVEAAFTSTILATLRRNGKIELVNENHRPPNMRWEFGVGVDGQGRVTVHVGVSC
ncbi:MAG TPA: hypothetical protein VII34_05035 [Pyrinomonadaceae bacterium]